LYRKFNTGVEVLQKIVAENTNDELVTSVIDLINKSIDLEVGKEDIHSAAINEKDMETTAISNEAAMINKCDTMQLLELENDPNVPSSPTTTEENDLATESIVWLNETISKAQTEMNKMVDGANTELRKRMIEAKMTTTELESKMKEIYVGTQKSNISFSEFDFQRDFPLA